MRRRFRSEFVWPAFVLLLSSLACVGAIAGLAAANTGQGSLSAAWFGISCVVLAVEGAIGLTVWASGDVDRTAAGVLTALSILSTIVATTVVGLVEYQDYRAVLLPAIHSSWAAAFVVFGLGMFAAGDINGRLRPATPAVR